MATLLTVLESPYSKWDPEISWFWFHGQGGPCWRTWGLSGLAFACVLTISLLIWPQDDNVVPPGMESLISAPLVKTSEKEEEQVGLGRGALSELGGVRPYPPRGVGRGQGLDTLTPDLSPLPGPHHVQQVPAALPLSVHALQRDPTHPQEAGATP